LQEFVFGILKRVFTLLSLTNPRGGGAERARTREKPEGRTEAMEVMAEHQYVLGHYGIDGERESLLHRYSFLPGILQGVFSTLLSSRAILEFHGKAETPLADGGWLRD